MSVVLEIPLAKGKLYELFCYYHYYYYLCYVGDKIMMKLLYNFVIQKFAQEKRFISIKLIVCKD